MRRGGAGPVGVGPRETGVDRTPPRRGHAPDKTPAGSAVAVERWTGPKRGGRLPARPDSGPAGTERPRPPGEAWTTGAAQRVLALEPGCFRYAYRSGHAARRCDVTRSLENPMETITSVAQTREGAACSLRTSRPHGNPNVSDGTCSRSHRPAALRNPVRSDIASIYEGDVHRKSTSCARVRWAMMRPLPQSQSEQSGHDPRLLAMDPSRHPTDARPMEAATEDTGTIWNTIRRPVQRPTLQQSGTSLSPTTSPSAATITATASQFAQPWASMHQHQISVGHDWRSTAAEETRLPTLRIGDA